MFIRRKRSVQKSGEYEYLQVVESVRDGETVRQKVIGTLGRADKVLASGKIDALIQSLACIVSTSRLWRQIAGPRLRRSRPANGGRRSSLEGYGRIKGLAISSRDSQAAAGSSSTWNEPASPWLFIACAPQDQTSRRPSGSPPLKLPDSRRCLSSTSTAPPPSSRNCATSWKLSCLGVIGICSALSSI